MRVRLSFAVGVAAALFSVAAVAQTATTDTPPPGEAHGEVVPIGSPWQLADRCAALVIQFDGEIGAHGDAANAGKAKKLRDSGEEQCKSGHAEDGIGSLTKALKSIGVEPGA